MKILMTGFEPFGESTLNPSQLLVDSLSVPDDQEITLVKTVLPVDQARAPKEMIELINHHQPHAILAFGLAMGRPMISLERVALNLKDFRIPDNKGVTMTDQPINPDGPAAYFSTLPLRRMLTALLDEGIPARLSLSAGAYLCNLIFYTMMHALAVQQATTTAGFIHLPALPEQAAKNEKPLPSLSYDLQRKAAQRLIKEVILDFKNNHH